MARLDLQTGSWFAADTLLGKRDSRRIGHNTTLHRFYSGDDIAVRYHNTDIVRFARDGWVTIDTGGWYTVTTWQRVHAIVPAPWGIHSDRGKRSVYNGGYPITPYVDGISVHADGRIGFRGETLLSADDVAAIKSAAIDAAQARADKRLARLTREHPSARTFILTDYPDIAYSYSAPGWSGHRGRGHASDCPSCAAEHDAWMDLRDIALRAEHVAMDAAVARATDADPWTEVEYIAAGSHVRRETVRTYPPKDGATNEWQRDYSAEPTETIRVHIACPWGCPLRTDY